MEQTYKSHARAHARDLIFELLTLTCSLSQSEPPLELDCSEEYIQLRSSWLCCRHKAASRGQQRQRVEGGSSAGRRNRGQCKDSPRGFTSVTSINLSDCIWVEWAKTGEILRQSLKNNCVSIWL